ncbi:MAG TPA: AgmX/PglI C-terminal domain-containing protein [Steroidobacteraceae bacterium]|nr:AgmX/PglI C-terminal domain-containing protein [Steroidobacteraceae bacterium]
MSAKPSQPLLLAPYYRKFELPWEVRPEERDRFQKILWTGLALLALFTLVFVLVPAPQRAPNEAVVPERLARVMIEQQVKPKPPPPKVEEKPKPTAKPVPVPVPIPINRADAARRKAQHSGLLKFQDELADLREEMPVDTAATRNLTGAVGADSHAERSLITSKVGMGSGGITSADVSRGYGSGAGSLTGPQATRVSSAILRSAGGAESTRTGSSGKPARSREEIELVFDRNKGAIYALYSRELREHPELQGKLVLEFTIAPSGEITMCRVVSSELGDPDLERKIIARVRLFHFEPKDVAPITTTKPIEFFPA